MNQTIWLDSQNPGRSRACSSPLHFLPPCIRTYIIGGGRTFQDRKRHRRFGTLGTTGVIWYWAGKVRDALFFGPAKPEPVGLDSPHGLSLLSPRVATPQQAGRLKEHHD